MSKAPALFICGRGHMIAAAEQVGTHPGPSIDVSGRPCPACWNAEAEPAELPKLQPWSRGQAIAEPAPPRKGFRLEIRYPHDLLTYASVLPSHRHSEAEELPETGRRLPGAGTIVAVYRVNDTSQIPKRLEQH